MSNRDDETVEQRLRAAVESAPSGLLMVDEDGRIVLVNREIERLFGYSREELLGHPVDMLVPETARGDHAAFREGFHGDPKIRAMGAGRDLYGLRKDGTEVPLEIGLTPVATPEGMFVLSSVVDISARKRAEARFRAAVESSPAGMVMVDEDGLIVLVNREVERLFGYARDELLGRSIETLVPERLRDRHPDFRAGFFREPRTRAMGAGRDLFGLHKDGTEIPVEIGLNPIETDEGLFVLSSIVDIGPRRSAEAQRQRLEEQLRQAQKMEAVGTLAGGIAHDFNNILAAIVGYAELLEGSVHGDRAILDLADLLAQAERGRKLVERLLAFSRRQDTVRRPLAVEKTLDETRSVLRATLPAGIEIHIGIPRTLPRILADHTAIQQILMNLANNAAQAMGGAGQLRIDAEPFYVRDSKARALPGLREGPHVMLTVRDSGPGMDAEILQRAPEPFFTTKPPGEGSGLGLSVVHGIMQEHEGGLELESEPGRGTTVRCFFPVLADEVADPHEEEEGRPHGQGERVLFVDDEEALAHIGGRRLEMLDYRPEVHSDPRAAARALEADPGRWDLVVTDHSMPGMTGLELVHRVRGVRPDLPVIMLTGYADAVSEHEARLAGVDQVLQKPLTLSELARAAARALRTSG